MRFMVRMDDILDGKKDFKNEGIGITTDGVSASVHFIIPKSCNDNKHEKITNMLNTEQLSLTPVNCEEHKIDDHQKSDDVDDGTWEDMSDDGAFNSFDVCCTDNLNVYTMSCRPSIQGSEVPD